MLGKSIIECKINQLRDINSIDGWDRLHYNFFYSNKLQVLNIWILGFSPNCANGKLKVILDPRLFLKWL